MRPPEEIILSRSARMLASYMGARGPPPLRAWSPHSAHIATPRCVHARAFLPDFNQERRDDALRRHAVQQHV